MPTTFRSFVIFAGMRTGSNLLEATLNAIHRVTCFGEAFNPYMMGWPEKTELKGISVEERDADPQRLLDAILQAPNLNGFRYFFDHDPRVFDAVMNDHDCAKIVLTRNLLDSYISTRLARETNQWKLNETETPIPAATEFDAREFRDMVEDNHSFIRRIQHRLQASGQAAFWLDYEDLNDPEVLTGMMHWLGRTDLDRVMPANDQVPQNPREMADKVSNFQVMKAELSRMDPFQFHDIPNFETRRHAAVPTFVAAEAGHGLIFQPILGGPTKAIEDWLKGYGTATEDFTQHTLRQWKRLHPGHRAFTVITHPVNRAWAALRNVVDHPRHEALRATLRNTHRVAIPDAGKLADLDPGAQQGLLFEFLDFLRRNLAGQTTVATHRIWASQTAVLEGFSKFAQPDMLLREATLDRDFAVLCEAAGVDHPAPLPPRDDLPPFLSDRVLRKAAKKAYYRDYTMFGFED